METTLGYDWEMNPIVFAGVNVNFHDFHGWMTLHWVAYYGREQTIFALINLEVAPRENVDTTPTKEKMPSSSRSSLVTTKSTKGSQVVMT